MDRSFELPCQEPGKVKNLGHFDDEKEAARAYDAEARKHYDERTLPRQSLFGGSNLPAPSKRGAKGAAEAGDQEPKRSRTE